MANQSGGSTSFASLNLYPGRTLRHGYKWYSEHIATLSLCVVTAHVVAGDLLPLISGHEAESDFRRQAHSTLNAAKSACVR
jgi:hypothetical protein